MKFAKFVLCSATLVVLLASVAAQAELITQPAGLNPGDQYRLVFVTSGTIYGRANRGCTGPTTAAGYDAFGADLANAVPALQALGTTWTAVISTCWDGDVTSTARGRIGATGGTAIYNLGGLQVASDNVDLWDGTIQNPINVTELGTAPVATRGYSLVWTGMTGKDPGQTIGDGDGYWSMIGPDGGYVLKGDANATDRTWGSMLAPADKDPNDWATDQMPIYVMSGVLTAQAVPEPSTMVLAFSGLLGLVVCALRRKN